MAVTYEGGLAYYQALGFRDPETTIAYAERRDLLDCINDQADGFGYRHDAPR